MKLLWGTRPIFLVLVVFVVAGVNAEPKEDTCFFPKICNKLCNGKPKTNNNGNICLRDDDVEATARDTCVCLEDVTKSTDFVCPKEPPMSNDQICVDCIGKESAQSICTVNTQFPDEDDAKDVEKGEFFCGCFPPKSPNPPAMEQNKNKNNGRRRGKFPPILAQLLAALQQVRRKFSGRQ